MRAVVIREHGGLDVLRLEQVPTPEIGSEDTLVAVKACALNHLDLWMRSGPPEDIFPWRGKDLPRISGGDVAGVVAEVGRGVSGVRAGDPVVLYPGLYCGACEYCRVGEHTMCLRYHILGEHADGGLAEYVRIPAKNLIPIEGDLGFEKAAAVPVAYTTAWRMLITRAGLRPGEEVLVLGVGGGVACAALQIAVRVGARVIAGSASAWKLDRARALGADATILTGEEPFSTQVLDLTRGRGVDVVVDGLGARTWQESIRSLARGGRLVICGATTGGRVEIDIREIYQRHRMVLGAPMGTQRETEIVCGLVWRGEIDPVVDRVLPLDQIAEAHRVLEAREQFGKVVVRCT
ncbi:MAG: alcohol dehydrogenase catalytic domain-containing protein [Armatimonadetes bacterium]|nr:alcohol dehydrogenase catalytic domain-containing protein [Armatimonadota bacterium]